MKRRHETFIHFERSAEIKNYKEILQAGSYYKTGNGLKNNECKVFNYYQNSAKMKCFHVGHYYQHVIGVEKHKHNAFIFY